MKDDSNSNLPSIFSEVNSKVDKRHRIPQTKFEVTDYERYDIITNAGDSAFMLYQYYLRMAATPDAPMEDDNAATYFSWSKRKAATNRKLLEALGYFKKITYCSRKGKRSVTYYLTKPRVEKA